MEIRGESIAFGIILINYFILMMMVQSTQTTPLHDQSVLASVPPFPAIQDDCAARVETSAEDPFRRAPVWNGECPVRNVLNFSPAFF